MPHRRTSSLLAAATATAALALVSPAASAAPIPLPHRLSGDSVTGAGHPGREGRPTPIDITEGTGLNDIADLTRIADTIDDHGLVDHHGRTYQRKATGKGAAGHVDRGTPHPHRGAHRHRAPADHLTITVRDSGSARTDGTFELYCHPGHGSHFDARGACDKLDRMTKWGKDPFAPVPQNANCTMMYGGPATAHVAGTWAGRPVSADFKRSDGCEISRWSRFEPVLPSTTL